MTDTPGFPREAIDPTLIRTSLVDFRNEPPPDDPSSAGCVVAIVAIIALVLMPFAARLTTLSSTVLMIVGGVLLLTAVVGGFLGVFGGGFVTGAMSADAEEAVDQLIAEFPNGDPERMRNAAVRILDQSIIQQGPTSVGGFDRHDVAVRLGPALEYVKAVELILLERDEIYPCFTDWSYE